MSSAFRTHDVINQSPPFSGVNLLTSDPALMALLDAMPGVVVDLLTAWAGFWGSADALELGRMADQARPALRTHDASGGRSDTVEYHPAFHALMRRSIAAGLHCSVWDASGAESPFRTMARAGRIYLAAQVDAGHIAAMSMTNAAIASLAHGPRVAEDWLPMLRSRKYDYGLRPAAQKAGVTLAIAVAEKQAGSDLRLLATSAERDGIDGNYRLTGHKWFVSAPSADALVTLAQTREGLSCLLVPRFLPDGKRNAIRLIRLKDKLGTRSLAAGEIELEAATGFLLGPAGEGLSAIQEAITLARLDHTIVAASLLRAALAEAVHHVRHRKANGRALIEQPLMLRVLADIALDCLAGTALAFRLAESFDRANDDPGEAAFARLMTPVAKYWLGKLAPAAIAEAMEVIGGNGAVEESRLPRFYRDAPGESIADGSGNVLCLDMMRVLKKSSDPLEAVLAISEDALGGTGRASLNILRAATAVALADEGSSRILAEQLAMTVAAATLRRVFPAEIADAFHDTRLSKGWRSSYGMLDSRFDAAGFLNYLFPPID